ncbi:acylneuraminate cytidylyltransferase family protein [Vibrio sp. IRLE0018]|uniref:acylneuraminate cytidylyltransferase family protein n=1 Tax=Vibrio floridensis TaxID=2908007 RepID=UPI001F34C34C|nr:acylneuraminate cytidylyltransferase family protein [Vibrio floridensis]MCF8780316.1 acylneuraminate cytidylyltransferase family protein [Vibrio floridensis]
MKKILAIIPARGGSKGVKRKNIRSVANEPLIYWSIKASKESKLLTQTYLNTDDEEIAQVGRDKGAQVLMRPSELAQDKTPMIPVLQYVCSEAEKIHGRFDTIVLLQPTAPMRTGADIDLAINMFHDADCQSLVSVYQVDDCHPSRMYRLTNSETLEKIYQEPKGALRQDLEPIYHRNGALYLCTRELLMEKGRLTCDSPLAFVMPKERSVNIDDEFDLKIADFVMSCAVSPQVNE